METKHFIGNLARAAGVSVQAVRYYERLGLLSPAHRTASGYRIYEPDAVDRLRFIKQAQALGFALEEVKEILRLRYDGRSPCKCVQEFLKHKLERVEREMKELARFRKELRITLQRSQKLPRLPHSASLICPLIQISPLAGEEKRKTGGGK